MRTRIQERTYRASNNHSLCRALPHPRLPQGRHNPAPRCTTERSASPSRWTCTSCGRRVVRILLKPISRLQQELCFWADCFSCPLAWADWQPAPSGEHCGASDRAPSRHSLQRVGSAGPGRRTRCGRMWAGAGGASHLAMSHQRCRWAWC